MGYFFFPPSPCASNGKKERQEQKSLGGRKKDSSHKEDGLLGIRSVTLCCLQRERETEKGLKLRGLFHFPPL